MYETPTVHCDFCGKPVERIDFHLTVKGGNLCAACQLLSRGAGCEPGPERDGRQPEVPRPRLDDLLASPCNPALLRPQPGLGLLF